MTDPNAIIKWFYRLLLSLLSVPAIYVVLQPSYNFAHWVPHTVLRDAGLSYTTVLYLESNADKILHPLGAFLLVILLVHAAIPHVSHPRMRAAILSIVAITLAEIAQAVIGRGFDSVDLILGTLGVSIGYALSRRHQ